MYFSNQQHFILNTWFYLWMASLYPVQRPLQPPLCRWTRQHTVLSTGQVSERRNQPLTMLNHELHISVESNEAKRRSKCWSNWTAKTPIDHLEDARFTVYEDEREVATYVSTNDMQGQPNKVITVDHTKVHDKTIQTRTFLMRVIDRSLGGHMLMGLYLSSRRSSS